MNKDIMICGVGGQGTVLASKIIAAAAMDEGNKVHSAETIGMAQRGGSVESHVRIGKEVFAIPLGSVFETMDINKSDINIVQHQEVTLLRGEVLPIIRLRNVLCVPTTDEEKKALDAKEDEISIVVCASGEKRAGFMVDELLGQQEIVIKSLGNLLSGIPGIMGATMRGDGDVALILDIPSFFQKGQSM